jgi:hypothetical protein
MSASHGKIQEKLAGKLELTLKGKNTHGKSGYQLKWSGQKVQSRASRTS